MYSTHVAFALQGRLSRSFANGRIGCADRPQPLAGLNTKEVFYDRTTIDRGARSLSHQVTGFHVENLIDSSHSENRIVRKVKSRSGDGQSVCIPRRDYGCFSKGSTRRI